MAERIWVTLGCSDTIRFGARAGICVYCRSTQGRLMFNAKLLDHFEHPRNTAAVGRPDASAEVENPVCGDLLRIALQVEAGRVEAISFRARGCVPAMACGSAVTELARGRSVDEARKITR